MPPPPPPLPPQQQQSCNQACIHRHLHLLAAPAGRLTGQAAELTEKAPRPQGGGEATQKLVHDTQSDTAEKGGAVTTNVEAAQEDPMVRLGCIMALLLTRGLPVLLAQGFDEDVPPPSKSDKARIYELEARLAAVGGSYTGGPEMIALFTSERVLLFAVRCLSTPTFRRPGSPFAGSPFADDVLLACHMQGIVIVAYMFREVRRPRHTC